MLARSHTHMPPPLEGPPFPDPGPQSRPSWRPSSRAVDGRPVPRGRPLLLLSPHLERHATRGGRLINAFRWRDARLGHYQVPPRCSWPPLPHHTGACTHTCDAQVLSSCLFPDSLLAVSPPAPPPSRPACSPGGCGPALNVSLFPPLPRPSRHHAAPVRRRAEEGDLLRVGQPSPEDSGFAGATP